MEPIISSLNYGFSPPQICTNATLGRVEGAVSARRLAPTLTQRSVRISRTTLLDIYFTAQPFLQSAHTALLFWEAVTGKIS